MSYGAPCVQYLLSINQSETVLDSNLRESYDCVLFKAKCDNVFVLMIEQAAPLRNWGSPSIVTTQK